MGIQQRGFVGRFCYREKKLKCDKFPINRENAGRTPAGANNTVPPWKQWLPESQESTRVTCRDALGSCGKNSNWLQWKSLWVSLRLHGAFGAGWGDTKNSLRFAPCMGQCTQSRELSAYHGLTVILGTRDTEVNKNEAPAFVCFIDRRINVSRVR